MKYWFSFIIFSTIISAYSQEGIERQINTQLDQLTSEDFSGTILVGKEDRILVKRAYGRASREYMVSNTSNTKFNIASITKMFTAVAMLQLIEEGKAELHEPIGYYLPQYPNELVLFGPCSLVCIPNSKQA